MSSVEEEQEAGEDREGATSGRVVNALNARGGSVRECHSACEGGADVDSGERTEINLVRIFLMLVAEFMCRERRERESNVGRLVSLGN